MMVLDKINLGDYGLIGFQKNQVGGLKTSVQLKNGYHASLVTNFGGNSGFYGNWEDQTFEMAVLDKAGRYGVFDMIDDSDYQINGGVWPRLTVEEIKEKIKIVEKL